MVEHPKCVPGHNIVIYRDDILWWNTQKCHSSGQTAQNMGTNNISERYIYQNAKKD